LNRNTVLEKLQIQLCKIFFADEAIYAVVLGGISMIIAAGMVKFVQDKD
jgi:hypothetical protein